MIVSVVHMAVQQRNSRISYNPYNYATIKRNLRSCFKTTFYSPHCCEEVKTLKKGCFAISCYTAHVAIQNFRILTALQYVSSPSTIILVL
jgi:hypothetical protein